MITKIMLRDNLGSPIQVESQHPTWNGVMCSDVSGFRAFPTQVQPVFATGIKCTLEGAPSGLVNLDNGATKAFEITVTAKLPDGGHNTTKYTLSVRRLGVGLDQKPCSITYKRSAAEDCGYAPILEKQRQAAALIPSLAKPWTPAPSNSTN